MVWLSLGTKNTTFQIKWQEIVLMPHQKYTKSPQRQLETVLRSRPVNAVLLPLQWLTDAKIYLW